MIKLKSFKKCFVESNFELVCSVYFIQIASRQKLTTHFDRSVGHLKSDNSITVYSGPYGKLKMSASGGSDKKLLEACILKVLARWITFL